MKTQTAEIAFPLVIEHGGSRASIYRVQSSSRGTVYQLATYETGKRRRRTFKVFERALGEAKRVTKSVHKGDNEAARFSGADPC